MRFLPILVASILCAGVAQAQVVSPLGGSTGNPQGEQPATPAAPAPAPGASTPRAHARTHGHRPTLAQRFETANTTHDGKLTLAQAQAAHLRTVVRDFAQIDKQKRGYVTLDDIRSYQTERRAARKAARASHQ